MSTVGEAFLPRSVGRHTERNVNGREEVLKDRNKEMVHRMVYRTWNDWHGNPHSGVTSHPYERWPRFQHPPRYEHLSDRVTNRSRRSCSNVRLAAVGFPGKLDGCVSSILLQL